MKKKKDVIPSQIFQASNLTATSAFTRYSTEEFSLLLANNLLEDFACYLTILTRMEHLRWWLPGWSDLDSP